MLLRVGLGCAGVDRTRGTGCSAGLNRFVPDIPIVPIVIDCILVVTAATIVAGINNGIIIVGIGIIIVIIVIRIVLIVLVVLTGVMIVLIPTTHGCGQNIPR